MFAGRLISRLPRHRTVATLFAALALLGAVVVASTPQLNSSWHDREHEIRIDGVNSEWARLDELDKGPAVAVANDADNLYLVVLSSDQQMRRELGRGVILWFDPTGGKKETFAIGIPGPAAGAPAGGQRMSDAPPPPPSTSEAEPIDQFDVYGPGKNQRQLVRLEPHLGVDMAVAVTQGTLAYELKLPLQKDDAKLYAVGARPGATIGFAIATPETPVQPSGGYGGRSGRGGRSGAPDLAPLLQGRGGFGGMGGGGGRRGGSSSGSRSNADGTPVKPLMIWTQLHLAVPAAR
jgi:hypothetical protein